MKTAEEYENYLKLVTRAYKDARVFGWAQSLLRSRTDTITNILGLIVESVAELSDAMNAADFIASNSDAVTVAEVKAEYLKYRARGAQGRKHEPDVSFAIDGPITIEVKEGDLTVMAESVQVDVSCDGCV